MAKKTFNIPGLPDLPDPTKDLFGGMTDPVALVRMGQESEVHKALFDSASADKVNQTLLIKPSAEAARALETSQRAVNEQIKAVEELRRKELEAAARQRAEQVKLAEANFKLAEKMRKEREAALKEKAKAQKGKLGAGADGSFVLTPKIAEVLQSPAWNSIVSDKERTANAEQYITDLSNQLRSVGATEEQIANEAENARNMFTASINEYKAQMNKDGRGLVDLAGGAAVKFGGFATQVGGVVAKGWAAITNGGDTNIDHTKPSVAGFIDFVGNSLIDSGSKINQWAEDFQSDAVKLNKANADFDKRVYEAKHPETQVDWGKAFSDGTLLDAAGNTVKGGAAAIKRLWDNDIALNTVVDFIPQLAGTMGTGAAAKQAIKPTVARVAAAEAAGQTASLGARLLTGNVATKYGLVNSVAKLGSAERLAMGAYGTAMGVTDAGAGAYEQVMAADAATIERHYGKTAWNNLLQAHGGNVDEAKKELASSALYTAVSGNAPVAAISSMFGIESAVSGLLARRAIKEGATKLTSGGIVGAAKWAGKSGLEAVSEGFEEGYTQYQSNLGANPYTGVNPYEGVTDAAALGAFLGAVSTGVLNAVQGSGKSRVDTVGSVQDLVGNFVKQGYLDYDQTKVVVGRSFAQINALYSGDDNGTSLDTVHQLKQRYYDTVLDNEIEVTGADGSTQSATLFSLMTPEQQTEFKEWVRLQEGINTNGYAQHRDSKEEVAWKNGDITAIRSFGNGDLINAYRLKHGIELDQIPTERRAYTQALLDTIEHMEQAPKDVNTREREAQYMLFMENRLKPDDSLSADDIVGITTFAQNILGANSRRMNNAEQQQFNQTQALNNGNQTNQQTEQGQPTGQNAPVTNDGTVAGESVGLGEQGTGSASTQTESVGQPVSTPARGNNAQGVGNGTAQQAPVPSSATNDTAESGAGVGGISAGTVQTQDAGFPQAAATSATAGGQTTQQGATGTTSQSGQSAGQTNARTTPNTNGGGSVGASPSERNTIGGSQQTATEVNDSFLADPANSDYVKSFIQVAYNDLGKFGQGITKHKADLRRLAGITDVTGGKLSDEHIDKLYNLINMPAVARTTLINKEFRTQNATHRAHNAVHYLKNNTIKAIKADIKAQEQLQKSAEREAERQTAQQAIQQEREQAAEKKRIDKEKRAEQAKISKAEITFTKADNEASVKEQAAEQANQVLADLNEQKQAVQDELAEAKVRQKEAASVVKEATKAYNSAVNEVTKANTAYKRELNKVKRKGLRLAWQSRVEDRNDAKADMMQAKKTADAADKAVASAMAKLAALNVKVKEAQLKAKAADKVAKHARSEATKAYDKLSQLSPDTQVSNAKEVPATQADVIDLSNVGITAVSIPYARKEFVAEGQPLQTVSGNSQIVVYNDRPIVLVTINGINVPFYRSTGKGGKADVQANKWYPFFGIGSDGWINKTSGSTGINDYYGSAALRQMAETLDTNITEDMIATARSQAAVGTPATSQSTYDLINQVFPNKPTDNGKADTLKVVEANIDYIVNALNGTSQTTEPEQTVAPDGQTQDNAQLLLEQAVAQVADETNLPVEVVKEVLTGVIVSDEDIIAEAIDNYPDTEYLRNLVREITGTDDTATVAAYVYNRFGKTSLDNEAEFYILLDQLFPNAGTDPEQDAAYTYFVDASGDYLFTLLGIAEAVKPILGSNTLLDSFDGVADYDVIKARKKEILQSYAADEKDIIDAVATDVETVKTVLEIGRELMAAYALPAKYDTYPITVRHERTGELPVLENVDANEQSETTEQSTPTADESVTEDRTGTPANVEATQEVVTSGGDTFNLQEILSGVTNKRIRKGEVPPTLNDLAPEDDTADRPTIELTINGKTHTGKLYRFRKGNRRFIAFVHDGNAYGMKAVRNGVENQDWINFGAGVGTKRVDSINAQTAINIRVLDGAPTQHTDNQQGTNDATKEPNLGNSQQSANPARENENRGIPVGDNGTTNDEPREVSEQSGQRTEQGQGKIGAAPAERPVGSQETERTGLNAEVVSESLSAKLAGNQQALMADVANNMGISLETLLQNLVDGSVSASDVVDNSNGKVRGEKSVERLIDTLRGTETFVKSGNTLVSDYLAENTKERDALNNYLIRVRNDLQAAIDAELDNIAEYTELGDIKRADKASELASDYQQQLKSLPKDAVEMVNTYLTDNVALQDAVNAAVRSTKPATNGFTFDSLPQGIKDILSKIWDSLKNTVAAVSMAIAVYAGSSFAVPNKAMAATPVEAATVQHIVETGDNQGKQFIVADKQAGTLTVYSASGVELTSTPALFGKNVGDSIAQRNTTPSGRYEMQRVTNIKGNKKGQYGTSAQALSVNGQLQENNAGNLAIHKVLPIKNRTARLNSATANDNRISHGCINVPAEFYDQHLEREQDTVVYVLPETEAGKTGVFAAQAVNAIDPALDNANAVSAEVSPEQIKTATPVEQVKTSPVKAQQPLTIAGAKPSEQVAYTAPVVIGGVTADQINVPFGVHTPAELQADGIFDTEPVSGAIRSENGNGLNLYDIAAGLATLVGAGGIWARGRKKKLTSKKEQTAGTTVDVASNHNAVVAENKASSRVAANMEAPYRKTPVADVITRDQWLRHIAETNSGGDSRFTQDFYDMMTGFEYALAAVMTDKSYEQANSDAFANGRQWRVNPSDPNRFGITSAFMSMTGGATPVFDKLMTTLGMPRIGHEADSTLPTKMLAQVKAKSAGTYAHLHKLYVKPMIASTDNLAMELRKGFHEVEADVGRLATVTHILNEGADALFRGRETEIQERKNQLDAVNEAIATTEASAEIRPVHTRNAKLLEAEINRLVEELNRMRDMYNGDVEWDGNTPLPGGYTKAAAQKIVADMRADYGNDFSKIEQNAKALTRTIRSIRNYGAAAGVYSNADLQMFADLDFTDYVPLYAEQTDPFEQLREGHESDTTKLSLMDSITQDLPTIQAKSMGLTKDLSRYHRKGATTPAADAYTNMKVFSMNIAGRVGQQGWVDVVQQMYEGTVGKPISATRITDEDTLAELNQTADSGKVPGLIRVRPGVENYMVSELKNKVKDLRPVVAKGYNAAGELVTYHYYFTEPAVMNEVYASSNVQDTLDTKFMRSVGTMTRISARLMTTYKPVWNAYNMVRDSFERLSIMLMRPVKNQNGELVNKWDLSKAYFANLATIASSLKAQQEIYRYLATGETKTQLQNVLHEAVGAGAINLITSQTEKHSIMADLKKSAVEKMQNEVAKLLGTKMHELGAGKAKQLGADAFNWYIMRLTEVPQITTALASYMAYQDVGVNKMETANRVRDQFDPLRTNNKVVSALGVAYPFIRSTFSGHYNLARSLYEYWQPGERMWTTAYIAGGVLATVLTIAAMSALMGEDDDGVPKLARLPLSTLMGGVPVPFGDNGTWTAPVGFGMNKLLWGVGATMYKYYNGQVTGGEAVGALAGLVVDNTSPVQPASGTIMADNPVSGVLLTLAPLLVTPLLEGALNTKSFGGGKIVTRATPSDQYDSDQDNFNVPDGYKAFVRWLRDTTGADMRPETARHLLESYAYGPYGVLPKVIMQDKEEKSLGNKQSKGEVFGSLLTAIGADMAIQPNSFDYANHTYAMQTLRYELHKKYGVGESHTDDEYETYADRGKRGGVQRKAVVVTERMLREKGVPERDINFIINGMEYKASLRTVKKTYEDLAAEYYAERRAGKDDPAKRKEVQAAYDALEQLTHDFVKENNRAYYEILQSQ